MKVLILANNDVGLYKFRKELIEKLIEENEVYVCLPYGNYVENIKQMGAHFIECKMLNRHGTNPFQELKLYKFYLDILKKINPDIVFTYTIKPNVYGGMACSKCNIPYVVNITGLGSAVENGGLMQVITVNLYRIGIRNARKVFFQNEENKKFMVGKKIVKDNYDLLPGSGVNLKQYKVLEYPRSNEIHFLFIARVMKEKGIEQFIDAAEYFTKQDSNIHFHVCGACEEEYEEKLKELQDRGVIEYHGLVDDMIAMQTISSCTVHPTYYPEGLSNVLLESCACARPVITTDRAGCREVVDNGVNGYVVKEKDSDDLIAKINDFINLPIEKRIEMGKNGRIKVEKYFDRNIVIKKYNDEVKKIEDEKNI